MLRNILAVISGLIAGSLIVLIVESLGIFIHPLPEGVKMDDYVALAKHAKKAPLLSQIAVIVGWTLAGMIAGWVSTSVSMDKKPLYAGICALIFLSSTIYNLVTIPSPVWFWVMGLIVWFPSAFLGYKLTRKKIAI